VLGFPFIFRGALDVRSKTINEGDETGGSICAAELAKKDSPNRLTWHTKYTTLLLAGIILYQTLRPKLITFVCPSVAKAAMETGVAREPITNWMITI
jgi:malate dehydrogenase (oxaloacetate-decarboxylating)(NADP+)